MGGLRRITENLELNMTEQFKHIAVRALRLLANSASKPSEIIIIFIMVSHSTLGLKYDKS